MDSKRKILIIDGHPSSSGFVAVLADSYKKGAQAGGHEVRVVSVRDLSFDPILHEGYKIIQELEPDLKKTQEDILWANHIVLLYPIWWASMPALLKGFLDRVMLPGLAFKYRGGESPLWDKLLNGKTGRVITTMDAPVWYHRFIAGSSARNTKRNILNFCGITPVAVCEIGQVRRMNESTKERWKQTISVFGSKGI